MEQPGEYTGMVLLIILHIAGVPTQTTTESFNRGRFKLVRLVFNNGQDSLMR